MEIQFHSLMQNTKLPSNVDYAAAEEAITFEVTAEEMVTGIHDDLIGKVKVYPNPSIDYIKIDILEGTWSANIYPPSGQIVAFKEQLELSNTIDLSQWKSGLYYVRLKNNNQYTTTKILIER